MTVNLVEGTTEFTLELIPDNVKEVNQLARFALGKRKNTLQVETTFYTDGSVRGYVTSKKHQHKNFGTVK